MLSPRINGQYNWKTDTLLWVKHFRNIPWKRIKISPLYKITFNFIQALLCLFNVHTPTCWRGRMFLLFQCRHECVSVITLITKLFEMIVRGAFQRRNNTPAYTEKNNLGYFKGCNILQWKLHVSNNLYIVYK